MSEPTFWNGEPTRCSKGSAVVNEERVRVVRVFYAGERFYLDDATGQAWRKVTNGNGSPRYSHRNVRIEPGTFRAAE